MGSKSDLLRTLAAISGVKSAANGVRSSGLAEGVSAELVSSMNLRRPTKSLISLTYPHFFIQRRLAESGGIPHKMWGEMWGAKWAERQGFEQESIPTRR